MTNSSLNPFSSLPVGQVPVFQDSQWFGDYLYEQNYAIWEGNVNRVRIAAEVLDSQGYNLLLVCFPTRDMIITGNPFTNGIPPYTQLDGDQDVKAGSILTCFHADSLDPAGIDWSLQDKGTGYSLSYTQFASHYALGGNADHVITDPDNLVLQNFSLSPFVVTDPGKIMIRVTNKGANYNMAQILFMFGVPKSFAQVTAMVSEG